MHLLLLTRKIEKAYQVHTFSSLVYTIQEIPAIFSNLEPGTQLAHVFYFYPLWSLVI